MAGDSQPAGAPVVVAGQWGTNQLDAQNLGFLAAHAKWRILRVEKGLGLALAVQAGGSPTGTPQSAGADPGFWFWPQIIAERHFGRTGHLKFDIDGGFRGHTGTGTVLDLQNGAYNDGDLITFGGGLSFRAADPIRFSSPRRMALTC